MKTSCLILFVWHSIGFAQAQLLENFNSGSLLSPIVWQGATSFFKFNAENQLQSNGPNASSILNLSTTSSALNNTSWQCWLKMDFESSTANYCKIMLAASAADFQDPNMEAYYLKVGGLSGSLDGIDLYYQKGTTHTRIIKGIEGRAGALTNTMRIQVLRDDIGNWTLYSDTTGGYDFELEGRAKHDNSFNTQAFGFTCIHSSTRSDKFYFDDVLIDTDPFFFSTIKVEDKHLIKLNFSKNIQTLINSNVLFLDGKPLLSEDVLETSGQQLFIHLKNPLIQGVHTLHLPILKSIDGDDLVNRGNVDFNFTRSASPNELLITEIMADPEPSVGLPNAEYIELYNTTNDTLWLANYRLEDPSTQALLPSIKLAPKQYLILTSSVNASLFSVYGNTLGLSPWPSLNNDKDTVRLFNQEGILVHEIGYSLTQFASSKKKEGGWAMEMIHFDELCKGFSNWEYSENEIGGTPRFPNSMENAVKDVHAPKLIHSVCINDEYWELEFDEVLDTLNFPIIVRHDFQSIIIGNFANSKTLAFNLKVKKGRAVWLEIQHIKDCIGNSETYDVELRNLKAPKLGEVWINEVLYNPYSYGKDFIELYNSSDFYLTLEGLIIQNNDKKECKLGEVSMGPKSYKVVTADSMAVKEFYPRAAWGTFVKAELPSLADSSGIVGLMNADGIVFDFMVYREEMQHPFLEKKDGFSLERVSIDQASLLESNWVSGSVNANGASPGYKNTQTGETTNKGSFYIEPQTISPGMDGYRNFAHIYYEAPSPGASVRADIYSLEGNWICALQATGPSGVNGMCTWDGTDDRKQVVSTGLYVLILNFLELSGKHYTLKGTLGVLSY